MHDPARNIVAWGAVVPWDDQRQIEQDLIISRALVEIFSDDVLCDACGSWRDRAHKLHFPKPMRYSEDIDLVRTSRGPIGPILDRLRVVLEPWLGRARFDQRSCGTEIPLPGRCRGRQWYADPAEGRDQHPRDPGFRRPGIVAVEDRQSLVLGRSGHIDVFARGDAGNQAARLVAAGSGTRSLRPRARAGGFENLDTVRLVEMFVLYLDLSGRTISRLRPGAVFAKLANPRFLLDLRPLLPATQAEL